MRALGADGRRWPQFRTQCATASWRTEPQFALKESERAMVAYYRDGTSCQKRLSIRSSKETELNRVAASTPSVITSAGIGRGVIQCEMIKAR